MKSEGESKNKEKEYSKEFDEGSDNHCEHENKKTQSRYPSKEQKKI